MSSLRSFRISNISYHKNATSNPRLIKAFLGMKDRCYDTSASAYKFYGAKGIKICDEWLYHPDKFVSWSLQNGYKDGLSIDRIDSSKDYCPDNCRWIPTKLNSRHKSTTNYYTVSVTGREAAKIMGVGTNYVNTYAREHGHEETLKNDRYIYVHTRFRQTLLIIYTGPRIRGNHGPLVQLVEPLPHKRVVGGS